MCKTMCTHSTLKAAGMLALRIVVGVIFMYMGYSKLGPNHAGAAMMMAGKVGLPGGGDFWAYFVGMFELVGGLMVLLGVYARYAAAWLAVIMVVAMATVHRGGSFAGYFLPLSMLGSALALVGGGAGRWRLVKTECHCKGCRMAMGEVKQGCACGGNCGCGRSEMKDEATVTKM
ncbi:MAG TPA: DoxX family protein [Patescibacteria group bacterium]|nr:DoxX family protein [Patescibacteria group bacterium]